MLTIQGKSIGGKRALFEDFALPLPPEFTERGDNEITLRELIEQVVRHEVQAFNRRQRKDSFVRALSQKQMEEGAVAGKISSGGKEHVSVADEEDALSTALVAFEDGMYFVIIDDRRYTALEDAVVVTESSTMTFVRLTLLAGG